MGRIEIPQRSSLLPYRGVLSFLTEAREASRCSAARRHGSMINDLGLRPIIFSVNCWIATILALFIAFSLDLKSPAWAMTTVYLTSQPLSGVMRAKAAYRAMATLTGAVPRVATVPNLVDPPGLTTLAIILWVALCVFFRCWIARRDPTCSCWQAIQRP